MKRSIYRTYRSLKQHFLRRGRSWDSLAFFHLLGMVEGAMPSGKPPNPEEDLKFRNHYRSRFGTEPLFRIETDHPIAVESDDHKKPRGAKNDNSTNPRFNARVYEHFHKRPDLRVLDLGCAGGGTVRAFIEDGYEAVGLEGSDTAKRAQSGEWPNCPLHLHTCNIAQPFKVYRTSGERYRAHCVTAWEVLEHIPTQLVPNLLSNVFEHLEDDGVFIASVDMTPDGNPVTGAVYHLTLQPPEWWHAQAKEAGLVPVTSHKFTVPDFVRGRGVGLKDWDPRDGDGFHLVLQKRAASGTD